MLHRVADWSSLSSKPRTFIGHKVTWRMGKVVVAAAQLLHILIVDQAFSPEVVEELEVRTRCT